MEEIKAPKKERRFLKAVGEVALTLFRDLLLGVGKKVINKVGNKRQGLIIAIVVLASSFAFAQYPATGNKQRLGYQTSGDGLVFRGRSADTVSLKPSTINNAYHLFDTVNNVLFSYIKTKGGWKFNNSDTVIINGITMPFDSITFNTAKDGTVGVGEVEYNDTQGSLIQGLKGGNVTNVIGQQLHQRVNNRTGSTLTKGTAVYLSGSQGNRITVAKALGVTDAFSANTFGIVAESIENNQSGYVITEGLITNINTSTLVRDSAVYLSPTVAGGLTSTKPQAPQHTVYIGVCVKSNAGSGELFVKIFNGQQLEELHNVRITSAVNNASLYYKSNEALWRDTTAALLVSDTASMLTNYKNTLNLKLNISDTTLMLSKYLRRADTSLLNLNSRFATKLNISDTATMLTNYLRTGVAASTYLTQSSASSTYLPLAGGTLTGNLNITNSSQGILGLQGLDNNTASIIQFKSNGTVRQEIRKPSSTANLQFRSYPTGTATGGYEFYVSNGSLEQLAATIATDKSLAVTGNITENGNNVLTNLDTVSLSSRINGKVGLTGNESIAGTKTFLNLVNISNQMTLSGSVSGTNILLGKNTTTNGVGDVTVGSGLNLSASNVLTATGGSGTVTSITVTAPLTISNPTTTPLIQITAANGTSTSGVVTTAAQQFGGAKTFNDNLTTNGNMEVDGILNVDLKATFGAAIKATSLERNVVNTTGTSITLGIATTWLNIHQTSNFTITLPNAATYPGKEIHIRNSAAGVVLSASSNIIALGVSHTGSTTTIILTGTSTGQFSTLVSDGNNWIQTQVN
jgi:hypothetical protein